MPTAASFRNSSSSVMSSMYASKSVDHVSVATCALQVLHSLQADDGEERFDALEARLKGLVPIVRAGSCLLRAVVSDAAGGFKALVGPV